MSYKILMISMACERGLATRNRDAFVGPPQTFSKFLTFLVWA